MNPLVANATIAAANSSGRPTRPNGTDPAAAASSAARCSAGSRSHQGVSTTPGETAFTRTGANSVASGPTMSSNAPLIAARPTVPGSAARAEAALTNVTEPPGRNRGSAHWVMVTCAQNFASNPARRSSRASSANGVADLCFGLL
jgi:hypothetical protein